MNPPRSLFPAVVALACALLTTSCGNSNGGGGGPAHANGLKVALITDGPVAGNGWNQPAYDALKKIQAEQGAQVSNQVTTNASQFESSFRGYAAQGYQLIFAHGDEFADAASRVAKEFPSTDFVTTGGNKTAPNLAPIVFATEQATYLQGMEAGYISKTGKGGFVGGEALPPVVRAAQAFERGAKAVNPKFVLVVTYINSWSDAQLAKAQTDALMAQGADVIAHNCDAAAAGLFQTAAAKPGVYTFGVNSDQNATAPNVVSSATLNIPAAFSAIAKSVQAREFKGQPLYLGIKEGDIALVGNPSLPNLLTAAQKQKIQAAQADIVAGKIDLKPKTL